MTQDEVWPRALTQTIADQVHRLRTERKLSAQQLADTTAGLGHPIPRSVIANLESGRRDSVSIAEVLVLAQALHVPPALIVFPLGHERSVHVLPGTDVDTWAAVKWFTGEGRPPKTPEDELTAYWPTAYFREQETLINEWKRLMLELSMARAKVGTMRGDMGLAEARSTLPYLEQTLRITEEQLRRHRAAMRKAGLDPGDLPPDAAHLDEAQG